MPTSVHAWMSIFPPRRSDRKSDFTPLSKTNAGEILFNKVVDSLYELDAKPTKSDFEHNVLVNWKKGVVQRRDAGLLAAAIMIHEKALLKKIDLQKDADSKHVGTVKERREFEVTITKKLGFETAFGIMFMILMKDTEGNVIIWKTGTGFNDRHYNASVGHKFKIKATVKKHDEYQGIKQTIVTRCAVVEEKVEEAVAN